MGYIFIDKEEEGGKEKMRSQMRRSMRGGSYRIGSVYGGGSNYRDGYREGYRHGWEDSEDDMDEEVEYRRRRDSRGRYM